MTPRTPESASMSAGAPVGICAATRPSTNMLLPVPTKRLMDRLPVLATKTYLPAVVIQHDAVCPAAMTDANEPSRKRPSWFECASVISAVPSGYAANPKGASAPLGAETAGGGDALNWAR